MKITITHAKNTPKWETLQAMLREAIDKSGVITRIDRADKGCYYRGTGLYHVDFRLKDNSVIPLELDVQSVADSTVGERSR